MPGPAREAWADELLVAVAWVAGGGVLARPEADDPL